MKTLDTGFTRELADFTASAAYSDFPSNAVALTNATLSHVHDYDDDCVVTVSHQGAMLVPAALCIGRSHLPQKGRDQGNLPETVLDPQVQTLIQRCRPIAKPGQRNYQL